MVLAKLTMDKAEATMETLNLGDSSYMLLRPETDDSQKLKPKLPTKLFKSAEQ